MFIFLLLMLSSALIPLIEVYLIVSSAVLDCLVGSDMRTFGIMLLLGSDSSFLTALVRPGLGMEVSFRDAPSARSLLLRYIFHGAGFWSLFLGIFRSFMLIVSSASPLTLKLCVVPLGH